MHNAADAPVAFAFQGRVVQAGAVEAVHAPDARLRLRLGVGGGVGGQVPALAVAHCQQVVIRAQRRPLQIGQGLHLGGDGAFEGHGEVLPPPHQGAVRSPEAHAHLAVRQIGGDGGELDVPLIVHHIHVVVQANTAEAHRVRHGVEQRPPLEEVLVARLLPQGQQRRKLPQEHALAAFGVGAEIVVGEAGENQPVHRGEGGRG